MIALQLVPVVLSLLVLAAHFYRAGSLSMVALVVSLMALLPVRRRWAARTVQAALLLGAVEWVRTTIAFAGRRIQAGEPVVRLVVILGSVALVTGMSAWMFSTGPLRKRYERDPSGTDA